MGGKRLTEISNPIFFHAHLPVDSLGNENLSKQQAKAVETQPEANLAFRIMKPSTLVMLPSDWLMIEMKCSGTEYRTVNVLLCTSQGIKA